jgi:hypothetical protein
MEQNPTPLVTPRATLSTAPDTLLVELDERRRASLARLSSTAPGKRYLARAEPDGTIILTPAVVMPAAEVQARISGMNDYLARARDATAA